MKTKLEIEPKMIEAIGLKESILFSAILKIFKEQVIETDNLKVFFLCGVDLLCRESSFSKYQQARLLEKLKDLSLIETMKAGIPAKRFIYVNPDYQSIIDAIEVKGTHQKDKLTVAPKRNS